MLITSPLFSSSSQSYVPTYWKLPLPFVPEFILGPVSSFILDFTKFTKLFIFGFNRDSACLITKDTKRWEITLRSVLMKSRLNL